MKYDEAFASLIWIPDVWSCCSGWKKNFHQLHRSRGCVGCDYGTEVELDYLIYNDPLGYADLI